MPGMISTAQRLNVSKPVQESFPAPQTFPFAGGAASTLYQGRNMLMNSTRPPAAATMSPLPNLRKSTAGTLTGDRGSGVARKGCEASQDSLDPPNDLLRRRTNRLDCLARTL